MDFKQAVSRARQGRGRRLSGGWCCGLPTAHFFRDAVGGPQRQALETAMVSGSIDAFSVSSVTPWWNPFISCFEIAFCDDHDYQQVTGT